MPAMRHALPLIALVALALAVLPLAPAAAWTPESQVLIAAEGAKLAPPDFFRQIARNEKAFQEGVLAPFGENDPTRHYKNADGTGQLDRVIVQEVERTIQMIEGHQSFERIARQVGRLAYFVSIANNPLNTSAGDTGEAQYYRDYASYVASASPRLPVIFYGTEDDLDAGDVASFIARTLDRGRKLYPLIASEYRRIGKLPGSKYFDDRSTAFGATSVAYSRAVSDIALILRYVWVTAGGADHRNAPRASDGRLLKVEQRLAAGDEPRAAARRAVAKKNPTRRR